MKDLSSCLRWCGFLDTLAKKKENQMTDLTCSFFKLLSLFEMGKPVPVLYLFCFGVLVYRQQRKVNNCKLWVACTDGSEGGTGATLIETLALQCDTICPGGALPKFYATCLSSRADESTCWPIRSDFHNTITHLHHPAAFSAEPGWY